MTSDVISCRFCGSDQGDVVVDLGHQPSSELFPARTDPGPDPTFPVRLWLCQACGLAQLADHDDVPEEVVGLEPEALRVQRQESAGWLAESGLIPPGGAVAEYDSPHGGSWLPQLREAGLIGRVAGPGEAADLVVDGCFAMMHAADQQAALRERAARLRPGGRLVVQFHSLAAIVRLRQWNAIRLGHLAYYSTPAMVEMLARVGLSAVAARDFSLYGGTVTLVASRAGVSGNNSVDTLSRYEQVIGVGDAARVGELQSHVRPGADALADMLREARGRGEVVLGYGAASRAVPLLVLAGIGADLLPAVADASPAKHDLRMPGTDIPVISPDELTHRRPDTVLLFVPDLLAELRRSLPEIEDGDGQWIPALG
ncbi:class I SAM-dependent methyltransferase [Pseudonocardia parietis]|uniref:SAM-dependent methyltransferase n=1 Tax=Pseudonocardia parietis TaxID=570936 RepID=A0ABS4W7B4_9PSEU|nr:class I SAM-dependent methyltransferase [Pseudonocardia parietis]MBP2371891.1 SAM-dependent methyltransferase [Pseudonocardia parietis]